MLEPVAKTLEYSESDISLETSSEKLDVERVGLKPFYAENEALARDILEINICGNGSRNGLNDRKGNFA